MQYNESDLAFIARLLAEVGIWYRFTSDERLNSDALAQDEDLQSESGHFYARLRHERYLNDQTQLSGITSSAVLAPGQVLKISGGAPQAFAPGAVITRLRTHAARDSSFEASFQAMPYAQSICFRPPLPAKPQIAGTVRPASPAHKKTPPTATSTSKAATGSTSSSTATLSEGEITPTP